MKRLFKWLFRLVAVVAVLLGVLLLFLDYLARNALEKQLRKQIGLEVEISRLSIGLLKPVVTIQNLKVLNSSDFGGSTFIHLPLVQVEYNPQALLSRSFHLRIARLDLGELRIVQKKDGKTNLGWLRERHKDPAYSSPSGLKKAGFEFEGIDTLVLSIGKLIYLSERNPVESDEIYIGLKDETLKNIQSFRDLQPLLTRLALEKDVSFISQHLFRQSAESAPESGHPSPSSTEDIVQPRTGRVRTN